MSAQVTLQQKVRYAFAKYGLVFIIFCHDFSRAHASLRLGSILSKVSFYCESAMGCPTTKTSRIV